MKSGSNIGIAVFDRKEPILKGINCNCIYVQQKKLKSFSLLLGQTSYDRRHILMLFAPDVALTATKMGDKYPLIMCSQCI